MLIHSAVEQKNFRLDKPRKFFGIPSRLWLFVAIVGVEYLPLVLFPHPWMLVEQLMAPPIVFGASLAFFGRSRFLAWPSSKPGGWSAKVDFRFLTLHLFALVSVAVTECLLLRIAAATAPSITIHAPVLVGLWYGFIALLVLTLLPTLFPGKSLVRLIRTFGIAWIYAASVTLVVVTVGKFSQWLWDVPSAWLGDDLQRFTFAGVKAFLSLFYTHVTAYPATSVLGTEDFQVRIMGVCSGIEGVGLMLVLTLGWLIYERKKLRLARALWLVPISLALVLALNIGRITALIAIGNAGHADIAVHGFHSESGWILFNLAAFAFLLAANHLRWLHKDALAPISTSKTIGRNDALIYLLPFIATLAASMVGHAASSSFDWLYPLRLLVAIAVLVWFRADYKKLDWRFGWLGPVAGAAIFALWFGVNRWLLHGSEKTLGAQLAHLPPGARFTWIAARAIAAVLTVPIAEELAFRGYVARRIVDADVEGVPFARLTFWAIAVSSLLFGVMHGNMWIAGTIAGVAFAGAAKAENRFGEAVAAHATANLLIAIWVLASGDFSMW